MTDDQHRFDPGGCPGCAASYADKFHHSDLAANLATEDQNLDDARIQNSLARPAADPAADVAHASMSDDTRRRPRQSITNAAVSPNTFLGRPRRRTTETRVRPSDEGD